MEYVLLLKGCAGLANRLSMLSQAIYHADSVKFKNKHDRQRALVVDWTDPSCGIRFEDYFKIDRIKTKTFDQFKKQWDDGYSVSPEYMGNRVCLFDDPRPYLKRVHNWDLKEMMPSWSTFDWNNRVVVHYQASYALRPLLFDYLRLQPGFAKTLSTQLWCMSHLYSRDPKVVHHIRYTDKKTDLDKALGRIRVGDLVCTDSREIIPAIKERGGLVPNEPPRITPKQGIHHIPETELQQVGTNKSEMFLSAMVDLFLLGTADKIYGDKKSSFYKFAIAARKVNWFNTILASVD